MTTPAERFRGWVEGLADAWKTRLKGWISSGIGLGIEAFADAVARKGSEKLAPLFEALEKAGPIPPELQPLIAELRKPTGEFGMGVLTGIGSRVSSGALGKLADSIMGPVVRNINRNTRTQVMGLDAALELWQRGFMDTSWLYERAAWEGLPEAEISRIKELSRVRLPSDLVLPLWLRDKAKYVAEVEALKELGLSQNQVEMLKELQYKMPTPQDVVLWLAREVFEPESIARYGLDDEWDKVDKTLFDKIGLKEQFALNYWRAHWQHASWTQVTEMLHRGHMTEAEVWDWFRLVEIPPFWRDKLIKTAYTPYTRVDIRRMWDVGALDDDQTLQAYKDIGYDQERAEKMLLFTRVYQRLPGLTARYKNGWIDAAQFLAELRSYGLSEERARWLFETKVKAEGTDRVADTRTITVAEIIKAVRQGQLDQENGVQLIESLGYEQWEARFKLSVALYQEPAIIPEERAIQIDTLRRRRRARKISRDQEIEALQQLNLTAELATAYADNDDLRLVKPYEGGAK